MRMTGLAGGGGWLVQPWGTSGGLAAPGCLSLPKVTTAEEDSGWWQRGWGTACSSQTTCGWDPTYLGADTHRPTRWHICSPFLLSASFPPSLSSPSLASSPTGNMAACYGGRAPQHKGYANTAPSHPYTISPFLGAFLPCRTSTNLIVKACSPFIFIAALIYFISKLLLCDDRLHYSVYKRQLLALIF